MKFFLRDGSKTFNTFYCPIGKFDFHHKDNRKADMILGVQGTRASEVHLNSKVLREILLTNPIEVRDLLGLEVKPYEAPKPKATVKEEPKVAPKPKAKSSGGTKK